MGAPKYVKENLTEFCQISLKILPYLTDFSLQLMACMTMTSIVRWGGQDTIPGLACPHPYSHHPSFCLGKILMVMVSTGDTEREIY